MVDRKPEALACFKESSRLNSDDVNNRLLLADAYMTWKQFDDARHEYTEVIARHPDSAFAYLGLGCAELARRDVGSARAAWYNATRFDPRGIAGSLARQHLNQLDRFATIRE